MHNSCNLWLTISHKHNLPDALVRLRPFDFPLRVTALLTNLTWRQTSLTGRMTLSDNFEHYTFWCRRHISCCIKNKTFICCCDDVVVFVGIFNIILFLLLLLLFCCHLYVNDVFYISFHSSHFINLIRLHKWNFGFVWLNWW